MPRFEIAEQFIELARASQTCSELFDLLQSASCEIGFRHFALVHHADLRQASPHVVRIENYPREWAEYFVENRLYADDPIHRACLVSAVGFSWSEVSTKISMGRRQWSILENAARHGLRNGYTVPINIPGESSGSCSFATEGNAELPPGGVLLAELIGAFAFEAARCLAPTNGIPSPGPSRLSPRQHDCLLLVIHGKTDKEIGRILGISEETVSEYLYHLRRRYKVAKRLTLAIRAIYDGQISFIEAFAQEPPLRGG
jgi:LuxR family transcriptional regulator, quorum-sensing system regulator CciR